MRPLQERALNAFMAAHHGIVTRDQAIGMGLTVSQIDTAVATGRWVRLHRGVYGRVGSPVTTHGALLAALATLGPGAVASHRSAAHLWGLADRAPSRPNVTVPEGRHRRKPGVEVHRSVDLDPRQVGTLKAVPTTGVVRTLVDLGCVVAASELDLAVDRARADHRVTVEALEVALSRLARPGRRGPRALREAMERRGLIEAPHPSVLESRVARLLRRWGIPLLAVEHAVLAGRYRLDFLLHPDLSLEVDGYSYHSAPEAKAFDARRRADLAALGILVIEADWVLVTRRPDELRFLIERALRQPARSA